MDRFVTAYLISIHLHISLQDMHSSKEGPKEEGNSGWTSGWGENERKWWRGIAAWRSPSKPMINLCYFRMWWRLCSAIFYPRLGEKDGALGTKIHSEIEARGREKSYCHGELKIYPPLP